MTRAKLIYGVWSGAAAFVFVGCTAYCANRLISMPTMELQVAAIVLTIAGLFSLLVAPVFIKGK